MTEIYSERTSAYTRDNNLALYFRSEGLELMLELKIRQLLSSRIPLFTFINF